MVLNCVCLKLLFKDFHQEALQQNPKLARIDLLIFVLCIALGGTIAILQL